MNKQECMEINEQLTERVAELEGVLGKLVTKQTIDRINLLRLRDEAGYDIGHRVSVLREAWAVLTKDLGDRPEEQEEEDESFRKEGTD